MKQTIKFLNDKPAIEIEAPTLKKAVQQLVKDRADLNGADLNGADLRRAKYGNFTIDKTPINIGNLHYPVLIFENHMQIGCKLYTHEEWKNFTDEEIKEMDENGLELWHEWKSVLLNICKKYSNKK